jgi:hypothetical protein
MIKVLEKELEVKESILVEEVKDRIKTRECPYSGECAGIYGCPKNYEDCLEYCGKESLI